MTDSIRSSNAGIVHTPLNTSQFQIQTTLLSDEAQDLSLMSVHMSWESSDDNVIIALTANGQRTDCNIPGRNPPCFIVSNTVSKVHTFNALFFICLFSVQNSVTISQLNSSVQYSVTVSVCNVCSGHQLSSSVSLCSSISLTHLRVFLI